VVREGVGAGGEMNQALYAHMNNKRKRKKNCFLSMLKIPHSMHFLLLKFLVEKSIILMDLLLFVL
jgi:hypothetical protein